ncbi:MAG: hypothetical protein B6I28_02920 [Fusobacteriia bacterium 4572_132]|nr:MAG: hypothetical protein B6I28_02920 [Fusobacteriia bacterium 4572_132]
MINLKVFTEYSYDKSIIKFNDYTDYILKHNLNYISISDDNFKSLYKLKKFIENNPNIKPIIGQEYVINGLDFYLIAKNNRGLKKMIEFSNSNKKTLSFLKKNEENIIICFGKPTKRNIKILIEKKDKLKKALNDIDFYSLIYQEEGTNIFYNKLIKDAFNNKTLEVSNVVYLKKEELKTYNNYISIMKYSTIDNHNNFILDSQIPFYDEIAVDLKFLFNDDYKPKFDFDETKEIKHILNEKVKKIKNDEVKKEVINRLTKEFKLIKQKNFSGFIYVIYDLVNYMKKEKILYNNRGSAGSSLVLYFLNIVLLNPLKYDFYFERFINEFRNELPDIDLDVQEDKIEQVLGYLIDKYSGNNIGKIISYSNFQFKSLTRRVLSSLGVENAKITQMTSKMINKHNNKVLTYDLLTKIINNQKKYSLSDEEFIKYKDFYDYINNLFKYYPKLYSSLDLIGNIYQQSKHSSGVIICNQNINTTFPVLKQDGVLNIQFDKKDIEDIEIIKLDLLNSVILKVISKTMKKAELPYEWFYSKNTNDPLVYKEFSKANTQCVFQFSSYTGKKVLEGSEVISFQDLFNRNACDRPGP